MIAGPKWELFVGGLPKGFNTSELQAYFEQFGPVVGLRKLKNSTGVTNVKLQVADEATFTSILQFDGLEYCSRRLLIQSFAKGKNLAHLNAALNECRVVVKHVPHYVGEETLKSWIVETAGPILIMFRYQNAFKMNSPKSRKAKKTYSVLFEEKLAAQRLVALKSFTFPGSGHETSFHQFMYNYKITSNSPEQNVTNVSQSSQNRETGQNPCPSRLKMSGRETGKQIQTKTSVYEIKPTFSLYYRLRYSQEHCCRERDANLKFYLRCPPNNFERSQFALS